MKKLLVLTTAVLLTLTLFTACSNKETIKENVTQNIPTTLQENTTYDDRLPTAENQVTDAAITKDEAKNIVLSHAGLTENEISMYKIELDRERKSWVYEIEFNSEKHEYEYEVNAETGEITKVEKEFRD